MPTGGWIACVIGVLLAGCASSPGGGGAGRVVSLAGGLVTVLAHRSLEVREEPGSGGAPDRVNLRRESRIRGSFENCTVTVIAIPADSMRNLTAEQIASRLAARLYQTQTESSGLHDLRHMPSQMVEGQSVPHDVVEWSYTLEHTMRARERY